jgi:mRNA-degrading endonuclease YafQ of YafQ-DinJ toxin-antitoxin module
MKYRASETFWKHFYDLSPGQKESARQAWKIFRENPFDPRLRTHKIHRLSAALGRIVYAADIEADLRIIFYVDGDIVRTVDIGSHDLYRQ